jgi:hypothetical protein
MFWKKQNSPSGITLLELLVSLALSSLMLAMVAGLFLFANKSMLSFQDRSFFNDQRILFETALRRSLRSIENMISADHDEIEFSNFKGLIIRIEKTPSGNVMINGKPLLPKGFTIRELDFTYLTRDEDAGSVKLSEVTDSNENFILDGHEIASIDVIELKFDFSYRNISRNFDLAVLLRSKPLGVSNDIENY